MTNPNDQDRSKIASSVSHDTHERDPRQDAGQDASLAKRLAKDPANPQARLDAAIDASMDASDPPSTSQPGRGDPAPSSGFDDEAERSLKCIA
jgi:hypothetical protein